MEEKEDLLFKIWDKVNDINTKVAVIQDRQDSHIKTQDSLSIDYKKLKDEHQKLKEDFTLHKGKFLIYAGSLGSLFGAAATFLYNLFFKHN